MLIHVVVESGAIFVQGWALKDRIEVEGVHSKIVEVIKLGLMVRQAGTNITLRQWRRHEESDA